MDTSGKALVEFYGYAADKGLMNGNTAGALRSACKEVLTAVDSENWESVDVAGIDVEEYATRFERLRMSKFKPASLGVYKARWKNAVGMFLQYQANPSGWRYKAERPAAARKQASGTRAGNASGARPTGGGSFTPPPRPAAGGLITYPYPVREGVIIQLQLPADLSKNEARRLSAFLDSLALEEQRALPAAAAAAVTQAG